MKVNLTFLELNFFEGLPVTLVLSRDFFVVGFTLFVVGCSFFVVGASVVGATVGASVVGATVGASVGASVVGASVVGASVVGAGVVSATAVSSNSIAVTYASPVPLRAKPILNTSPSASSSATNVPVYLVQSDLPVCFPLSSTTLSS